jgi:hypothetical protein
LYQTKDFPQLIPRAAAALKKKESLGIRHEKKLSYKGGTCKTHRSSGFIGLD